MDRLYRDHGVTALMVEGGARTLNSFIESGLFDEIRIEVSQDIIKDGVKAPDFIQLLEKEAVRKVEEIKTRSNNIYVFERKGLIF